MTPEQAAALRQPFPKSAVGLLPKPYKRDSPKGQCNECGGYHGLPAVHLDYVGHAAVTDRLLSVDPDWTWEPLALDAAGLPMPDRESNLWIKLTINGVTRLGVGDGNSMKERIGDAIRNAAMRFGVALDLWSKEELEQSKGPVAPAPFSEHGTNEPDRAVSQPPPTQPADTGEAMKAKTRGQMFALFGQKGVPKSAQLAGINQITGRDYESRGDLTEHDARLVIDALKQRPDAAIPEGSDK